MYTHVCTCMRPDCRNVDRMMHLTNYSLNKHSEAFEENDDTEKV